MLVSFLVPVYNVEKYLETCLDSLLRQKGCPYEIVLLDDGSTDSSGAICDRYAELHPDIIRVIHKENEGLLMTRRRGFAEARGDWFICVDSDDYVAPTLLETIVQAIRTTNADMVMYNYEYVNDAGYHFPSRLTLENGALFIGDSKQRIYAQRLLTVDVNMMWMRALKRDIVDFDTDYSTCGIRNMCEDAVQVLALYTNATSITYLSTPLYYYRKSITSITAKTTFSNWQASNTCFGLTQKYLKIWNIPDDIAMRYYTHHLEYLCNYVRWLFSAEFDEHPATLPEMLSQLKDDPGFLISSQNFRKKYAHSKYLSVMVPIITHFVDTENTMFLRIILKMERFLHHLLQKRNVPNDT